MREAQSTDTQATAVQPAAQKKREPVQVTLSTIGDVAVATEGIAQAGRAPQQVVWKPILLFSLVVYVASVALTWLLLDSSSWVRTLLPPLFPVLCATAAYWWRQRWKFRAQDWKYKLKVWEEALDSLGHEAANAANAIRANLIGFRLANSEVNYPEDLDVVEEGAKRIDSVVQKAQDPVAWSASKKKKKKAEDPPTDIGQDTRSRISL